MKSDQFRISINTFPGICFGIMFPMDRYTDMNISILFFNISLKWRKR